jgi:hypothetical protein
MLGERRTVDSRAMVRRWGRGAVGERLLAKGRGKVADLLREVVDSPEETWYTRPYRDWPIL